MRSKRIFGSVFTTAQLRMTRAPSFKLIWSFEMVTFSLEQLILCYQSTGETRKVHHSILIYPESYVESLVAIKSGTYVDKGLQMEIRRNLSDRD